MRTILLIGKHGQIGWELQRTLEPLGRLVAVERTQLDLSVPEAIRRTVRELAPDVIVNAAAYTNVDLAESEFEQAHAVNATAPGVLAEEAGRLGAWLVHYSTDYVFDGSKRGAYLETDAPNPLNVYGASKLAGERAIRAAGNKHLILRTSWVYGARGRNFLQAMLRLAAERSELRVVDDQIGAPTWARSIAEVTAQMLAQILMPGRRSDEELAGIYHLSADGAVSWYGFAQVIFELAAVGAKPNLVAVPSIDYPAAAKRPANSQLVNERLEQRFGLALGNWRHALGLCLADMEGLAR